jgi:HSP20 family protein
MTGERNIGVRGTSAGSLNGGEGVDRYMRPEADIFETPDAFVVMLDMPGARRESIVLAVQNGTMTVQAQIPPHHAEGANLLLREIAAPGYYRAFTIGDGVDVNNVDAHFDLGVLTVKLFKSAMAKPRTITIN